MIGKVIFKETFNFVQRMVLSMTNGALIVNAIYFTHKLCETEQTVSNTCRFLSCFQNKSLLSRTSDDPTICCRMNVK